MAMSDACPEAPPEGSRSKLILVDQYGRIRMTFERRTVYHDAGIWKAVPFSLLTRSK